MIAAGQRFKIEEAFSIRVRDLVPALKAGVPAFTIQFPDSITGAIVDTLDVTLRIQGDGGTLRLGFGVSGSIALRSTRQPFGGRRWHFICPDGHGPCSTIYRPAGETRFASRKAWRMSYPSQRTAPRRRAADHAVRVRLALGGSTDLSAPFPERPAGMWRATYERLRAAVEAATTIALADRRARPITTEEQRS